MTCPPPLPSQTYYAVQDTNSYRTEKEVDAVHATIECEQPQPDLYKSVRRCERTSGPVPRAHLLPVSVGLWVGSTSTWTTSRWPGRGRPRSRGCDVSVTPGTVCLQAAGVGEPAAARSRAQEHRVHLR